MALYKISNSRVGQRSCRNTPVIKTTKTPVSPTLSRNISNYNNLKILFQQPKPFVSAFAGKHVVPMLSSSRITLARGYATDDSGFHDDFKTIRKKYEQEESKPEDVKKFIEEVSISPYNSLTHRWTDCQIKPSCNLHERNTRSTKVWFFCDSLPSVAR
jgi:hypothetical protein